MNVVSMVATADHTRAIGAAAGDVIVARGAAA